MRAEGTRSVAGKETSSNKNAAPRTPVSRWRNPFKPIRPALEDIEEERDASSTLDDDSWFSSEEPRPRRLFFFTDPRSNLSVWMWNEEARQRFSLWLKVAAVAFFVFFLVVLSVLVLRVPVPRPEFVVSPRLVLETVEGSSFSVSLEMDMDVAVHYVVIPAARFSTPLDRNRTDFSAKEVAGVSRRGGGESALSQV